MSPKCRSANDTRRSSKMPHVRVKGLSEGVHDLHPALFLQVFNEWNEKEKNDLSKWQLFRYLLKEFFEDKKFLATLLSLLDPLQRKDGVYYEMSSFKKELIGCDGRQMFSLNLTENFENEGFLKEWFSKFDSLTKQNVILKLLKKIEDRHLFCLTKMIRWRLFEIEELECESERKDVKNIRTQQRIKKSKSPQKADVWDMGLLTPSKYLSNFALFLPLSLTKKIFGYLDRPTLSNCIKVSRGWRYLAQEVINEKWTSNEIFRDETESNKKSASNIPKKEDSSCLHSPYNMTLVVRSSDSKRVMDFNEDIVAFTSSEKFLLNVCREPFEFQAEKDLGMILEGGRACCRTYQLSHVGTVRCILLFCSKGFVITCSYDATIRRWSLQTGKCQKIYSGHGDVVCCISNHGDLMLSGSYDKSCKVWSIESGKCQQTYIHDSVVTGVSVHNVDFCVTSTSCGMLRVFNISNGNLIKKFQSHDGPVSCLKTSRKYLMTSSIDGLVKVWTFSVEESKKSLVVSLEHPKGVQCIDLIGRELISGCDDGRIRIWSLPDGACSRILWGNRHGDPILHLKMSTSRLLVNTISSILLYDFSSDDRNAERKHELIFGREHKTHRPRISTLSGRKKGPKKSSSALQQPWPSPHRLSAKISSSAPTTKVPANCSL